MSFARSALLAAAILVLPSPLRAQSSVDDQDARQLFLLGENAYESGRYESALDYFQQAYAHSRRPQLLFNIGQTADRLRNDALALESLEAYLRDVPTATNRATVEARIVILRRAMQARTQPPPPTDEEAPSEPAQPPPVRIEPSESVESAGVGAASIEPDDAPEAPSNRAAGDVLVSAGGASAVGGLLLGILARRDRSAVESASVGSTWAEVSDAYARFETRRTAAVVMAGVGLAAGTVGTILLVVPRGRADTPVAVRVGPTHAVVEGRF